MPKDSTTPEAVKKPSVDRVIRDVTGEPPPFGEWMTEQKINDILVRNYKDVRLPDPLRWALLAGVIRNYQREPPTNHGTGVLTATIRKMQRERATLDAAAKILEADAKRKWASHPDFLRRYAEAVQILRMPRGAADNRRDVLSKISDQGPAMVAWSYVTRAILDWLAPVFMQNEILPGGIERPALVVSSRHTSPFVKSLREILGFIWPPDKLPTAAAISDVVSKYLDKH